MKDVSNGDEESKAVFDFVENILRAYFSIYSCKQDLEEGEAIFNDLLIFPFLKAVAKVVVEEGSRSGANFKVGEVPLQAMANQLNDQVVVLLRLH